jgi:peptide/nickel transport system substrate-binding protein
MKYRRDGFLHDGGRAVGLPSWVFLLVTLSGCGSGSGPAARGSQPVVLRVGVTLPSSNPLAGVQQLASNQSFEGLIRLGPDGRPQPWLAKSWTVAHDKRSITVELRPETKFSDGSVINASSLVQSLKENVTAFLGPVSEDIGGIESSADGHKVTINFKQPSPFLLEALEVPIKKPGAPGIGTGPFALAGTDSAPEIRANPFYYLGRPIIDRIVVTNYPTTRAAWAEMLRNNLDMLYEVSADAAHSMEDSKTVSTFTFTRPYQYMVILNVRSPKLKAPEIRRALNVAIDREAVVRDGFDGHAIAAVGLVSPQNWAFSGSVPVPTYQPEAAAAVFRSAPKLVFNCLVPTDYERVALVIQRQLAAVGVTMNVEATAPDRALQALGRPSFEAVLMDIVDGPSLLRPYEYWHTGGSLNLESISRPNYDSALDRVRHATSDDEYRVGVAAFQKVTAEDPPAIYLAWGQRSRAISKRFDVPVEAGRDVLSTLRLWKPAAAAQTASRN